MLKFCPNCGENLQQYAKAPDASERKAVVMTQPAYNQTEIWKEMVKLANACAASPPTPEALILPVIEESASVFRGDDPVRSVVHIMFDRAVAPQGGLLHRSALGTAGGTITVDQLEAAGYLVRDGKVVTADDVPVGLGYQVLDYWGGERQHKRWHLAKPVSLNPSRHGDPYFMDDNMVAFGARWSDGEKLQEALLALMHLFLYGINDSGRIAIPLAFAIYWQHPQP